MSSLFAEFESSSGAKRAITFSAPKDAETLFFHPSFQTDNLRVVEIDGKPCVIKGEECHQTLDEFATIKCLRYVCSDTRRIEYIWLFTPRTPGAKLFLGENAPTDWVKVTKCGKAITKLTTPDPLPTSPTWQFSDHMTLLSEFFNIIDSLEHPLVKKLLSSKDN